MKKIIKSMVLVAAAAMGFTSCLNDVQEEAPMGGDKVVVSFVAGTPDTKTSVDTSDDTAPVFSWNDDETFAVLEQTDALAKATSVAYQKADGKAKIDAEFAANAGKGSYKYVTVYPEAAYVSAESISAATLRLPAEQTMVEGSYDPAADLMVSKVVETVAQPTEAQQVQFTRLVAVAKMTLKNLGAGEKVEKVIFTAEGKDLAGTVTADLAAPHGLAVTEGVDNVSVAAESEEVFFTVLPTTLEAGDTYTVTVITDKYLYVKKGTILEGKELVFEAGWVTRFNVDMADVAPSEKWVLVRDASTLAEGDIVTIAASDYNYVMGKMGSSYAYASFTEVIKLGDYLYHPVTPAGTTSGDNVLQQLILEKSDKDNAFHFYNGVDFTGDSYSGYVCIPSSNYNLKVQNYPDNKSLFYFEIDSESGAASVVASNSGVTYNALKYRAYNSGTSTSNRRFGCVNTTATDVYDVCIYKVAGKTGAVPTAGAVVSVPDEYVVVPVEGVAEATAFEDVKFTYVGDWKITAATDEDGKWLTLNYADGVLKYSAGVNPGTVRYATVTITATHEGEDDKTWTFNVVQKGAPVKVTVAEFIEKAVDAYVEYEVTGILTKKATSASGSTTVADAAGKTATFKYIDMADGNSFINNEDIKVGDIVTIVAAVSDEATGGSSSAHAICKGYYNLQAEVENDLVAYTGGSVEVTLNKLGTLAPAGNITCTADADFASVEYTTDADKATVTLKANDGAPRQVTVTFTDGYAETSVAIVQSADTGKGNTWELVTDASSLEAGDQVIIAAKDYDVAMSTTISSDRRSAVDVTKLGNYYITPSADVQILILANGSVSGTFAFYDGANEGYLVSSTTSSSTYNLKNNAFINENASFAISVTDGETTINNTSGTYSSNKIYYREGSSYNYFYSGTSVKQPVSLYRLVGVKGEIPVSPADVTVPDEDEPVVVAEEGAASATKITDVTFNYVGDWNIAVEDNADWLELTYDAGAVYYTAQANEGTVREASATITATMDGQEPLTWTFNILQKGAPMEVSIAEFITKGKDENVTYRLTGVVTTVPSSYSNAYVIEDGAGNKANIKYLKTEEDNYVVQDDNMDVRVGDVITVTTVVTTTTKGTGGSSTYPSYFKGYYRLTAEASTSLVSHEGESVTITLATEGNLLPADAVIKGAITDDAKSFVIFDYTAGAETATATFAANDGAPRNATFNFTYGLASASVTVGQYNHPDVKIGWYLVTDVNELKVGDKVIIAAKSPDGTLDYAIKTWTNTSTPTSKPINVVGNYIPDVTDVQQFTIASGAEAYPDTFAFVRSDDRYLCNSSGSVKTGTSINEYSSWGVTIDSANNGAATLKCSKASSSKDTIALNWTTGNQSFGLCKPTDVSGKGAIYLYKLYE